MLLFSSTCCFPSASVPCAEVEGTGMPSDQPAQPTAKRKPGRPKGSGRKALLLPNLSVRRKSAKPKGPGNTQGKGADWRKKDGHGPKVARVKCNGAKSANIPHPTLHGVWKTPPGTRKIPPGQMHHLNSHLTLLVIMVSSHSVAQAGMLAKPRQTQGKYQLKLP